MVATTNRSKRPRLATPMALPAFLTAHSTFYFVFHIHRHRHRFSIDKTQGIWKNMCVYAHAHVLPTTQKCQKCR